MEVKGKYGTGIKQPWRWRYLAGRQVLPYAGDFGLSGNYGMKSGSFNFLVQSIDPGCIKDIRRNDADL